MDAAAFEMLGQPDWLQQPPGVVSICILVASWRCRQPAGDVFVNSIFLSVFQVEKTQVVTILRVLVAESRKETLRSFECRSAQEGLRTFLKSSLGTQRVIRYAVAGHEEFLPLTFMCFHFYTFFYQP